MGQSHDEEFFETKHVRLNDSLSMTVRQITQEEYTIRAEAAAYLRHKPHEVIRDYAQAREMLGDRLKMVQTGDEENHRELEIAFNDGTKLRLNYGGAKVDDYFLAYYPELNIVILEEEAGGGYAIDFNDSSKNSDHIGNPGNRCPSPDRKLRINGYYPGGAADGPVWFIEKQNDADGRYALLGEWTGESIWEYYYASDWAWTDNTTVLFKTPGYYYEAKLLPSIRN